MFRIYPDGNVWCAVHEQFKNLQESPAGFGDTPDEAIQDLIIKSIEEFEYWQAADTFEKLEANQEADGYNLTGETIARLIQRWTDGFYLYGFRQGNNEGDADLFLTPKQIIGRGSKSITPELKTQGLVTNR